MCVIYFIHYILNNRFRPLLLPSSGWCYYYKNTIVQMWLVVSTSLHNNWKLLQFLLQLYKNCKYRINWVIVKMLGFEIVWWVRSDVWCGDVVSFNIMCSWCVEGVVYWLESINQYTILSTHTYNGKAVPLQAWSDPEGSRKLRFPDFMTTVQDGGKVSLTHRPPLPAGNTPGTHFC